MQHCSRIIHYKLGFKNFDYHSLRHTHATMLLSAGANIKAVQERLGHKKVDLTLDTYTHVTEEMRKETLEILNKYSTSKPQYRLKKDLYKPKPVQVFKK